MQYNFDDARERRLTDEPVGYIGPGRGLDYNAERNRARKGSIMVERRECELEVRFMNSRIKSCSTCW